MKDADEALSGLQNSPLELDPALLKELALADPKNLKSMSKEQLDQLREALKKGAGAGAGQGMGQEPGDGEGDGDALAKLLEQLENGSGEGLGEGDESFPGQGGINRGPGSAPLTLSKEENAFGTEKNEGVSSQDMSRARLSTQLGLQNGKHDVDKTYDGPGEAGKAASAGQGGEQVWRETLTPEEKAVLKRVFR